MKYISNLSSFWKLVLAIVVCELTGIASSLIAGQGMDTWYASLHKPSWHPASSVFGPVWTILYLMMGISIWLVSKSQTFANEKSLAGTLFALQLLFNFFWSIIFFGFHSPGIALIDIVILDVLVGLTIIKFERISRPAAWLLVPYLLWICFATFLNYRIWALNS